MMPLDNAGDLLFQLPRPGEPESNLEPGMAAPREGPGEQGMADTSLPGNQQLQEPGAWSYDFNAGGTARATFNGEVVFSSGGSATSGVTTWNGRSGTVTLTTGDITGAGGAVLASPAFTGTPSVPTAPAGTATTQVASTQFVANAIGAAVVSWNGRTGAVTLSLSDVQSVGGAPIAGPNFTGIPAAPTASPGTATTQIATTAFVTNALSAATAGVASFNTRTGAVTLTAADLTGAGGALLLSPTFTGTPAAPTQTAGDNSTKLATTAFVATAIGAMAPVVASFNARTGTVTLQAADVTGVGGALLASPTFSGTPAGPTPPTADNSTRLATTAYVQAQGYLTANQNITLSGYVTGSGTTGIATTVNRVKGVTDGSNAAAGDVGEVISSTVLAAAGIAITSGTPFDVTSIVLSAGDWDVSGTIAVTGSAVLFTGLNACANTAATFPDTALFSTYSMSPGAALMGGPIPPLRVNVTSNTTVYLHGQAAFSGGSGPKAMGYIMARRRR